MKLSYPSVPHWHYSAVSKKEYITTINIHSMAIKQVSACKPASPAENWSISLQQSFTA